MLHVEKRPERSSDAYRTMTRRYGEVFLAILMVGGLTGCGRDPDLYNLASVAGPVVQQSRSAAGSGTYPVVVEVRTPVVSTALDRDEIVRRNLNYKLQISKGDAWAQPLGDMIGRTIALDLAQRLPGVTIFAQNDAIETKPQAFVEITVTSFNEDQNGEAVIQGHLAVHGAQDGIGPVRSTAFYQTMALPSKGTGYLVYALSQLLARLADDAALRVQSCPVSAAN